MLAQTPWEFPAIDPVLIDLPGFLDIRYYGLMYVLGFLAGQWILVRFAKSGFLRVEPERIGDLIALLVVGVILGGRIGYALFYDQELLNPAEFIKVWKGGLSFHGGLLGVFAAFIWFARRNHVSMLRLGDCIAMAVTPGILFVRLANFINGELYGRETTADTFGAMRFPTDPIALRHLGLIGLGDKRAEELGIQAAYGHRTIDDLRAASEVFTLPPRLAPDVVAARFPDGGEITWERVLDWDAVQQFVPYRHPSQLYEGFGEGVLVGLMLWLVYTLTRKRALGPGTYGGLFLIGYGVVRFFIEFLRKPDAQFITPDNPSGAVLLGMTMGQTLCSAMIVAGVIFVANGYRLSGRADEQVDERTEAEAS